MKARAFCIPAVNAWFMVILAFMLGCAATWFFPRQGRYQLRSIRGKYYRFDTATGKSEIWAVPLEPTVIDDNGIHPLGDPPSPSAD